jgi:hypothetical protein
MYRALNIFIILTTFLIFASCNQKKDVEEATVKMDEKQITQCRERIVALKAKVQRIKDGNDIKRLQRIFGYYFDRGLWDEMKDLFAENATLEYARDGVYIGKEKIREYFYAFVDYKSGLKEGQLNEHFQLMPVITLSDDGLTAKGRWLDLSLQGQYGKAAFWGEGPYENEYVKVDGVWKISKLCWYQTILVPYAGGWAKNEDANQGIYVSRILAPDRPLTKDYGYWPETFLPPFHFNNPVAKYRGEGEK